MPRLDRLLLVMAACTGLAGLTGWLLARAGGVWLLEPLAARVPPALHARFLADLWAHGASYACGLIGGLVLTLRVWHTHGVQAA